MPMVFRKSFKKSAIIMDCFEIFPERPSALDARTQAYKSMNGYNYFVNGWVSNISVRRMDMPW